MIKTIFESILKSVHSNSIPSNEYKDHPYFKHLYELDYLEKYLNQGFNEVIIHSNLLIQLENDYKAIDISTELIQFSFELLAHKNKIAWNYNNPTPSFTAIILNQLFRVTLIHKSCGGHPKIFIRRINKENIELKSFIKEEIILNSLQLRKNILIAGSSGSGKTTFMASMIHNLDEHIVILEDTKELPVYPQNTYFLGLPGVKNKELMDYYTLSLRLSPDRIILGELRSTEVIPLILSLNTGHKGIMTTVHANSASDALLKTALLFSFHTNFSYENALKIICNGFDEVYFLDNKKVIEIIEVKGATSNMPIFKKYFDESNSRPHY